MTDNKPLNLRDLHTAGKTAEQILESAVQGTRVRIRLDDMLSYVLPYLNLATNTLSDRTYAENHRELKELFENSGTGIRKLLYIGDPYENGSAEAFNYARRNFREAYDQLGRKQ